LAQKIINILREAIIIDNQKLYISTSIGIAIFPDDSDSERELLKYADSAMSSEQKRMEEIIIDSIPKR